MSAAITDDQRDDPSTGYLLNDTVLPWVGGSAKPMRLELTPRRCAETVKKKEYPACRAWVDRVRIPMCPRTKTATVSQRHGGGAPGSRRVFEIYLKRAGSYENARETERDRITTDQDGFAASKDLPLRPLTCTPGIAQEVKPLKPDFTVFISEHGKTYSYIPQQHDDYGKGSRWEKRDAETGNIIRSRNGLSDQRPSTGEFVKQEIYYPDPETLDISMCLTKAGHASGSSGAWKLRLYEVAAPFGYVLSGEAIPFNVDGGETVVTVTQYNMPQKGTDHDFKTGEVFFSVQENEGRISRCMKSMGSPARPTT